MNRAEYFDLLAEKTTLEQMIADTPEADVIDHASLTARLAAVNEALASGAPEEREPARARLTFKGRPVVGSHGIFAEFATKALSGFVESVAAMGASLTAPLAAMGRIPNRDQHQLLVTSTAIGSFGFELEEHRGAQLALSDASALSQALDRTQSLLRATLGSDDDLAESAAEADRRALDKVRTFLQTLADSEAVCTVQFGDSVVSFLDVGQVRTSVERLSKENVREELESLHGELQGILPKARIFEFKVSETSQVIKGRIAGTISDPDVLNRELHRPISISVMVTRVGTGKPRYILSEAPKSAVRGD